MAFPATFKSIQDSVIAKARLDASLDLTKTKDWINQVYSQVCIEAELIVTATPLTLTANQANAVIPSAVKRITSISLVPAGQTALVGEQPPLKRTSLDDILGRRANAGLAATSGQYPRYFAVIGLTDLELWPTPAGADVLTIYGVNQPTALAADADVPVIDEPYASKLLEYGALVEAGDFKGDPNTAAWQQEFGEWMNRWLHHLERQMGDIPAQTHQWGSLADTRSLYGW